MTRATMKPTGSLATKQPIAPMASAVRPTRYTRRRPTLSPTTPAASNPAARPTDIELSNQACAPAGASSPAAVTDRVAIGVT